MNVIIGGGVAGLAAAIGAEGNALLLERNQYCGKKLLLSGSGKCNVTNAVEKEGFLQRLGEFRNWLKPAFYSFDNEALMDLLEQAGCPIVVREDSKVFPLSMRASDVRDTLLKLATSKGTKILYDTPVQSLEQTGAKITLHLTNKEHILADKVIIACGGSSYPQTGSDGSSYSLANNMGHRVISPVPALASIMIRNFGVFSNCSGMSFSSLRLKFDGKYYTGSILFTHHGFSGPLILDNSYRFTEGKELYLRFVPDASSHLSKTITQNPKKRIGSILHLMNIPSALCEACLIYLDIPLETRSADLSSTQRRGLCNWLENAPFVISEIESLQTSMSDYGGVHLCDVNAKTMQSRINPNVFFVGESLAYSLPTGGFSIQMAFSTGFLAGKSMNSV